MKYPRATATAHTSLTAAFFRFTLLPPPNEWGTPFQVPSSMRGHDHGRGLIAAGPFTAVVPAGPTPPANLTPLDGTLYVDPSGQPWMVYAHEWLQTIDGPMEAIRLAPGLFRTIGDPVFLPDAARRCTALHCTALHCGQA